MYSRENSLMAKQRIPIPNDLATEVQFASDRTCCICNIRGKFTQIHHIDSNPSNNTFENLAVLCLQCHNETEIKGGFGRKLSPHLVRKYRDEWLKDIESRKNLAIEMAATQQIGKVSTRGSAKVTPQIQTEDPKDYPDAYINSLPDFRLVLLRETKRKREELGESTLTIVETNRDYIDVLIGILVTLATNYYAPDCFGSQSPQEFISEIIYSRFRFHSIIAEPDGPGTGGSITPIMNQSSLIADIEKLVEILVGGNWIERYSEYENWQKRWRSKEIE